jgi:hypothetical protein
MTNVWLLVCLCACGVADEEAFAPAAESGRADKAAAPKAAARALVDQVLVDAGLDGKLVKEGGPKLERKGPDWAVTWLDLQKAIPAVAAVAREVDALEVNHEKRFYPSLLFQYQKAGTILYLLLIQEKSELGVVGPETYPGIASTVVIEDNKYRVIVFSATGERHGVRRVTYRWSSRNDRWQPSLDDWED